MMTISGVHTGAIQPLPADEAVPQKAREEDQGRPRTPVLDEYIPEEPQEPSGCYWLGRDEDGQPKIYFDDQPQPGTQAAEKKDDETDELCVGSTDKVDRAIEALKQERQELEQQINTETDEAKIKALERQLAQVERELREKDNETYRRQHTQFS